MRKAYFFLLLTVSAHAGEVRLQNDSPYPLIAQVSNAAGKVVGTQEVPPQQTVTWEGDWSGGEVSQTPYSVRWICKNGGKEFSACTFVSEGALVTAETCPGNKTCPTKKTAEDSSEE